MSVSYNKYFVWNKKIEYSTIMIIFGAFVPIPNDTFCFLKPWLIAVGALPVMPDKFIEKTIRMLAMTATFRGTRGSVPGRCGYSPQGGITVRVPVIFKDIANIFSGLKESPGSFKERNYSHLFRI
jgi:hypothetical protein